MPPKRDIRNFFKPAPALSRSDSQSSSDATAHRTWPSPRTLSRQDKTSSSRPANSPTPTPAPGPAKVLPEAKTAQSDPQTHAANQPPATSQSSNNSNNSKRIVSNGEEMVLNSDSDSDSDILPEIDLGFKAAPSRTTATRALRSGVTSKSVPYIQVDASGLRMPSTKLKAPKPSLAHLVRSVEANEAAEQRIAAVKADLEKPAESTLPDEEINEEFLAGVVGGGEDGDKARRLYLALKRTNAASLHTTFHFLGQNPPVPSRRDAKRFPVDSLPNHGWVSIFEDSSSREQAFLTGFAEQVFNYQELPPELAEWIFEQISCERDYALSARYIQLLRSENHTKQLQTSLTPNALDKIFRSLGADTERADDTIPVEPVDQPRHAPRRPIPRPLISVLNLLHAASRCMSRKTKTRALFLLFHLALDDSILSDAATLHVVQDTVEILMSSIQRGETGPILSNIVPQLLSRITHPVLQINLVRSLPAKSPLTASFQRYLALSFLLHPTAIEVPLSSPEISTLIHNHLKTSPSFHINSETDYPSLAALLSLLDIAIGPGLNTVPYQPLLSPPVSQIEATASIMPSAPEQHAFNKEIDYLVKTIKYVCNGIQEVGALGEVSRLDVKDASERMVHRLENAVRIGGKKINNPFADREREELRMKAGMSNFVQRLRDKKERESREASVVAGAEEGGMVVDGDVEKAIV
ncbi:hypothetical protein P154DRAFT_527821 [Amniculicola lignicola CBS 123094]|uniref:Uncharacterized protein n=1 Tax=Amniculicola lignicola CBS 123094 TaxID=1392246 RepID=A0A6A5VZN3_9PLEO|nr:hypothetical protein P154DRAFT_527821 [Amniculicola lignicola CBS 123094]